MTPVAILIKDDSESCISRSVSSSIAPCVDRGRDIKDDEGDVSSSVKVIVRVRPICPSEVGHGQCIDASKSSKRRSGQMPDIVQIGGEHGPSFVFDFVFPPKSSQKDVFSSAVMPLIESCLEGYNATILAYGQTGSGKTYTVFGPSSAKSFDDESSSDVSTGALSEAGIIPRALTTVFRRLDKLKSNGVNSPANYEYEVRMQFLELYGEDIFDLLASSSSGKLSIRDGGSLVEPEVIGATELKVTTAEDALIYLTRGALRRITGATAMNAESSRSHAIMTLIIEQTYSFNGSAFETEDFLHAGSDTEAKRSKFHFVDLAGSERQKRSLAVGLRLKEGININKGLLVLGNVISALGDPMKQGKVFVPYRDSKLTRLLKGSLGGNHKTLMIACVSPSSSNMEESLNCLRYANRAKNIQNKAVLNAETGSSLLFAMRNLLKVLATELLGVYESNDSTTSFSFEQLVAISQGKFSFEDLPQISFSKESESYNLSLKQSKIQASESGGLVETAMSDVSSESSKRTRERQVDDRRFQRSDPVALYDRGDDRDHEASLHSGEQCPMSQTLAMEIDSEQSHLEIITDKYIHMAPDIHISLSQESEIHHNSPILPKSNENIDPGDNIPDGNFSKIQKNIQKDMTALSQSIATKEHFIEELEKSQQKYELMRNHYETKLTELGLQLSKFEAERESMINSLNANPNDFDASQNIKMNISEKEHQILALKKRQTKLATLSKSSVQNRHIIDSLKSEVESLKRQKTDLQRKLLTEQSLHYQEVSKLKKEAATHEREAERSRVDLHRLLKEKEQTERVAKMRSDEISRLRFKYRDIEKKKRMLTIKRGVMDKVGIDLVLLGRNRVDRKISANTEFGSNISNSLPVDIDIESIRAFLDTQIADVLKKETCADKLAHAWEDHLELIMRRDELNESSVGERDDVQEQLDDINIQILYKEEIIRALAKGLGDRPKSLPTGDDLFKHIFKDNQLLDMFPSLAPMETSHLLSKILFGMLVRERRRVAALARTASILDQKLIDTSKWAESQESTLQSQLEEEKMQNILLTKRQQEQISSLMELAQMEKSPDVSDGDPVSSSSQSDSMIIRLANERIIALEALLAGYQCNSLSQSSRQAEERKFSEEHRLVETECERLRDDVMSLREALLRIKTITTSSCDDRTNSGQTERDSFKDRAICKIVNEALQPSATTPKESNSICFGDRSATMMELLNPNDEESMNEMPDWVDDIMEDLAIIARGELPPSIKKVKIPDDVVFSTHKNKSLRTDDTPSRRMTRFNGEIETEYSSVFERLQSPSNYTGVQKQVHDELRRRQLEKKSFQSEVKQRSNDAMKQRAQSEIKRRISDNIESPTKTMSTTKALDHSDVFKRLQETETKSYSYARKATSETDVTSY